MDMVLDIDLSGFPEPLQKILRVIQVKGALAAPEAFNKVPILPLILIHVVVLIAPEFCVLLSICSHDDIALLYDLHTHTHTLTLYSYPMYVQMSPGHGMGVRTGGGVHACLPC